MYYSLYQSWYLCTEISEVDSSVIQYYLNEKENGKLPFVGVWTLYAVLHRTDIFWIHCK